MAGSKIFLEPILSKTVASIDQSLGDMETSLQNVKQSVDVVPGKIDAQITELQAVASTISNTVNQIYVSPGSDYHCELLYSSTKTCTPNTSTPVLLLSFESMLDGFVDFSITINNAKSQAWYGNIRFSDDGGTTYYQTLTETLNSGENNLTLNARLKKGTIQMYLNLIGNSSGFTMSTTGFEVDYNLREIVNEPILEV